MALLSRLGFVEILAEPGLALHLSGHCFVDLLSVMGFVDLLSGPGFVGLLSGPGLSGRFCVRGFFALLPCFRVVRSSPSWPREEETAKGGSQAAGCASRTRRSEVAER